MTNNNLIEKLGGSFRDPSGFMFKCQGEIFRQVNWLSRDDYDLLINSGLYAKLIKAGLLIPHAEVNCSYLQDKTAYKILKPFLIPFVSYPYEWSFSQLKDAALTTLKIQRYALDYGMSLKDASAFNIQFWQGKPILIDTLSFERYRKGRPWVAYRQFCQFFLAPLALISYNHFSLNRLLLSSIDGIPLDLASDLLPWRTWYKLGFFLNLHLPRLIHRWLSEGSIAEYIKNPKKKFSEKSFQGLIDNLQSTIENLKWVPKSSSWSDYSSRDLHSPAYGEHKKNTLKKFLEMVRPQSVWDLGAGTGIYSRICASQGSFTVSCDADPLCVERNYLECKDSLEKNILPLLIDLTNPSPALGWMNLERFSLIERGPADMIVALALLHHLSISNNLPFEKIVEFFHRCSKWVVIEFVPKHDPQTQKLLSCREDIFADYHQAYFELEFSRFFKIIESVQLDDSPRILYLLEGLT